MTNAAKRRIIHINLLERLEIKCKTDSSIFTSLIRNDVAGKFELAPDQYTNNIYIYIMGGMYYGKDLSDG